MALNATASGGSAPYTYAWDVNNDGQYELSGSSASYSFPDNGAYTVRVKVTDSAGTSATAAAQVTVSNAPPMAAIDCPSTGTPGESVTFSGSATDPSTADTAAGFQYRWDFGDGQTSNQGITTHVYNTVGVYDVTLTVTDKDGGQGTAATAVTVRSPAAGVSYYVAPKVTSGNGTFESPWGLPDLYTTTSQSLIHGVALTSLQPGDTLYFMAGTYTLTSNVTASLWTTPLIAPTHSGTAASPITLMPYPGAAVTIIPPASSYTPTMGSNVNYVRMLGFTIYQSTYGAVTGGVMPCIYITGSHNEVGYCNLVGADVPTDTDNSSGIRFDPGGDSHWVHHNYIHGFIGANYNQVGIKNYRETNLLIEDNYFTDNNCGIEDKDSGTGATVNTIYARNWFSGNLMVQFLGNVQGVTPASYQIYDNVIDGAIYLGSIASGHQVFNNLIRTSDRNYGYDLGIAAMDQNYQVTAWNNIIVPNSGSPLAFWETTYALPGSGATAPLGYLDYNVYTAAPEYLFQSTFYTQAQMQSLGFELHTTVTAASNIFVDQVSYVLKPAFQTAGRYGDPVGPRYPIAQILNTNRYGPGALN